MAKTPLLKRLRAFAKAFRPNPMRGLEVIDYGTSLEDDDPCLVCDDAHKQGWYDAGFSEAERVAFCQLLGCLPPNEG